MTKEEWTEIWGKYDISQALKVLSVDNVILEVIPLALDYGDTLSHKNEPGVLVRYISRRELRVNINGSKVEKKESYPHGIREVGQTGAIMETPNDPFKLIQDKIIEAIDACGHILPNSEENKEWLPKVVGLLADVECFIDTIHDVEMPNKNK